MPEAPPIPGQIELEQVKAIKAMVEKSLPRAVIASLEQAGVSLILGLSSRADFQPVIVDPAFADELAEKELVEEMVSYRKDVTGIDHTVFISPKGQTRHSPRLKLAIDPPDTVDPRSKTASIAIKDAAVVAGEDLPAPLLDQVGRFIEVNRGALLDCWEHRYRAASPQTKADQHRWLSGLGNRPSTAPDVGSADLCAIKPRDDAKNCVWPALIYFILMSIWLRRL